MNAGLHTSGNWLVGIIGGLIVVLTACGGSDRAEPRDGPRYVTTIPPFEMILEPVVQDRGTVTALLKPGGSPHSYEPAPSALRSTTTSTALVYGAEHLDGWAADLPAQRRLALLNLLPPDVRRTIGGDDSGTIDPHFWTDPQAVLRLLPALADTLCVIDAQGCSTYKANADSFATSLTSLDTRLEALMRPVRETPVYLSQPFFQYFLHRYGPRLVGVVDRQPGAEPTPRQLQEIVNQGRASGAKFLLTQTHLSDRAARAVAEPLGLPMVALDPLGGGKQRTTLSDLLLSNAYVIRDSLTQSPERPHR